MKFLIFTLLTVNANAACNLTLKKRTVTNKAAYIGTQSISAKVQDALKTVCTVNYRLMSTKEVIDFEKQKFEKKINKLKAQAQGL